MELDLYKTLPTLSARKTTGIPNEKVALQLIWEPLFGYRKGIRTVDPVSQIDFGALSGLPFICSASAEYRFLSQSSVEGAENFQKSLGKRLNCLGYINGDVINMDGHSIKLFSRKEMKASYLSKDKTYGKAIRTFYTQDQASKKPLFAKVAYSGATVAQVTPELVEANKEILGGSFLTVNDKEWFIGSLLEQLDKIHGIQVLLPVKRTPKRLREMKAIPFEEFKYRYDNQPVAKLVTDLDGFTGQMKMFVKRNSDNTFFALITNKKYFRVARAMEYYQKRWRIENFFNENVFLGLDQLPSLELNAIQTSLTLKMVSFHHRVEKFTLKEAGNNKIPHIGFNSTRFSERDGLFSNFPNTVDFYYVHSYRMLPNGLSGRIATCSYGIEFLAAFELENICGSQFHPEKSQTNGLILIKNFLEL